MVNAPFGRIPTKLFVGDPSVDTFTREQEMIGYQFERNLSDSVTFRQNARYAHVDLTYRGLIGNGYTNIATGDIGRYNWYAKNTANQGNLDNQLEYRFDTGPVQHTMLFGLDLKNYRIDDYQIFAFGGVPSINAFNPVYGVGDIPFTGSAPFRNFLLTQNQLGIYLQDQIKFGGFTLVLSGRNDWVSTSQGDRPTGATLYNREDSKFSGRAGLIYNFANGLAPYVSYATSYNPIIGLNASNQLFLPETGEQAEIGLKYQPSRLQRPFQHRRVRPEAAERADDRSRSCRTLQNQTGEITSRGLELEAVANPLPGLKMVGAFTTYDLFTSKDPNPALIGLTPTNTPQQTGLALGRLHVPGGAAARALALAAACAMSENPLPISRTRWWFRRSCSATRRSITNGRTGARRSTSSTSPTRSMSQAARRIRPASTAIGAASTASLAYKW